MALVLRKKDGTFATKCALCGETLSEPIFSTSQFRADDLQRYADASMHWDCYAAWDHQPRFARLYFAARCSYADDNAYWPIIWKSDDALVTFGVIVNEVSVVVKESGTDIRIDREAWPDWITWKWQSSCQHSIEEKAVEKLLPKLSQLSFENKSDS